MRTHSTSYGAATAEDLTKLAQLQDHAVLSLLLPPLGVAEARLEMRNLVKSVDGHEMRGRPGWDVVEAAHGLAALGDDPGLWNGPAVSFAAYADGPEVVMAPGPEVGDPTVMLAPRFHIAHLIGTVRDPRFAVLALSRGAVRLYRHGGGRLTEVATPGLPTTLADVLRRDDREPHLQSHGSVRHGGGAMAAAIHGQGGRDDDRATLARFLRYVAAEVEEVLGGEPLVLAATQEMASAYRRTSRRHSQIMDEVIAGNPERSTPPQLHSAAIAIVRRHTAAQRRGVVGSIGAAIDADLVSTDPGESLTAAFDGRVERLIVACDQRMWGYYDVERRRISRLGAGAGAVDLLNEAAAETWLHGGDVIAVSAEDVPGPWLMVAQLRF